MTYTRPTQTVHIFAKDIRRFWPEILVSLALLTAFAAIVPLVANGRPDPANTNFVFYTILQTILYALIPISWWVLTSRVIHEENLVGDRQFWITRPYRWPSLLAAKLLFLAAFILLPVALAQAAILFASGFQPQSLVSGILFSTLLLAVAVILPLAALSSVTTSFARLTVTMLALFIGVLVCGALLIPRTRNFGVTPHPDWPYLFLISLASVAVIMLQYARRRTVVARSIIGAATALLILFPVFFSTLLMPVFFHSSAGAPAEIGTVSLDPAHTPLLSGAVIQNPGEFRSIAVPVVLKGFPPNALVALEASKVTITTSSGLHYTGPWRSTGNVPLHPESSGTTSLQVLVPKAFFDQIKTAKATLHLSIGLTVLTPKATAASPFPTGKVDIPGIGLCTPSSNGSHSSFGLSCTSPLRSPAYTYISARWSDVECNQAQPPANQLVPGDAFIGSYDGGPADFGLSPLVQQPISFSNGVVPLPNNAVRQRYLCPGTPLTFTRYVLTRRSAVELTVPDVNLAALPTAPESVAGAGIGIETNSFR